MRSRVILEGIDNCDAHKWCDDDACSCQGVVCSLCLAVRELDGESE